MTPPLTSVIIPFRDRGTDPARAANLSCVLDHWNEGGHSPLVIGDSRSDKELFNRCAAYNRGVEVSDPDTEVFVFAESDMLVDLEQVEEAVELADQAIGMVVPFSTYCYHSAVDSVEIRNGTDPERFKPLWVMANCTSIGAVNVLSRATMQALGRWDEKFEGNWYDDDAMKLALEVLTAPTRFVEGKGHHLYHLPGHRGRHLTVKEKAATHANQRRLSLYEQAARTNNAAEMRRLLKGER